MSETLGGFLDALAAEHGSREVVAWAPRDTVAGRLTWTALRAASREAAAKLVALGVGKGSRVGLLCSNRLEWLPLAFGALRVGAVLVPLSTLWTRDELAHALAHADVQLLLMVPRFLKHDYAASVGEILPELATAEPGRLRTRRTPALRRVVLLEGEAPGMERWADAGADVDDEFLDALEAAVAPTDVATVFFTSGTTARPKAVVHCHGALTTSARAVSPCLGVTTDDAWWGHLPLFWSGGFILGALATMAGGGRVVLQEVVEVGTALALLEREGCTIMSGWHQAGPLTEHPDFAARRLRLTKGTAANHPLAVRLLGADHKAISMYGMSETATCVAAARWDDPEPIRAGTFGRPLGANEIRVVDPESGRIQPPGETGEILVRGPTLMEGYYRVPRSETFDRDGFFRTGDLGFLDAGGALHFASRLKDVIKTAGVNVAAIEVEEVLARHPAVKAAYVVGVPHTTRGENVAAFVVFHPGAGASPDELRAFCRDAMASYKVPRHVFPIAAAELPVTGTGKIEKAALRRAAAARVAASA